MMITNEDEYHDAARELAAICEHILTPEGLTTEQRARADELVCAVGDWERARNAKEWARYDALVDERLRLGDKSPITQAELDDIFGPDDEPDPWSSGWSP